MVNYCKVCGIIKSFQTTNADECGWTKPAELVGAGRTHARLGKYEIDDGLSLLALTAEGPCCNCQRKKAGWSLPDFKQRACQHCLRRRKLRVLNENNPLGQPRTLARSRSDPTDCTLTASSPDPAKDMMAEPARMNCLPQSKSMTDVRTSEADGSRLQACRGEEIITKAMHLLGFSERDCDVAMRLQLDAAAMVACTRQELRDLGLVATAQQHMLLVAFARGFIAQHDLCPRFLPQTPPGTPRGSQNAGAPKSPRAPPTPDIALAQAPAVTDSAPADAVAAVTALSDPAADEYPFDW